MKARAPFGFVLLALALILTAGPGPVRGSQPAAPLAPAPLAASPGATAPWYISTVDSDTLVGQYVSVAIDPVSGVTYISYYDDTNKSLKMATHVGSGGNCGTDNAWSCEMVDGGGGSNVGRYSSIAIDPTTNLPVIAYRASTPHDLNLANGSQYLWSFVTIDDNPGKYASLKIDATGAAHIAYHRYGVLHRLNYAEYVGGGSGNCGGGDYQCDTIDSSDQVVGVFPSLALDGSGQPRIAYYDAEHDRILYAERNDGAWTIHEIQTVALGQWVSLAVDAANGDLPHIAYYDGISGKLNYARYVGSSGNCGQAKWQCDELDSMGTGSHTRDVALALDPAGLPVIVYHKYIIGDPLSIVTLNLIRPAGALGLESGNCGPHDMWWCDRIQDSGHPGDFVAIAINPDGLATVAYYNSQYPGTLKVAYQQFDWVQVFLPVVLRNQ